MQRLKKDNRGLTLLELLISVIMLGLLAAPLLQAFVISSSTSAKARSLNETTNAATNLIEQIKGSNLDFVLQDVMNGSLFSTPVTLSSASDVAQGNYDISISGYQYNGRTYSGYLTLDASQYKQNMTPTNINDELMVKYSFTGLRAGSEMSHFEITAANDLTNRANVEASNQYAMMYAAALAALDPDDPDATIVEPPSPPSFAAADILSDRGLKRKLIVSIAAGGEPGKEQLQVVARCEYSYTYNSGSYYINVSADPLEQVYYGPYDPVLYFFYFPIYLGGEEIVMENPQDLPLTIFLVKQWPTAVATAVVGSNEAARTAWMSSMDVPYIANASTYLTLHQSSQSTPEHPGAVIFSNIAVDIANGSSPMTSPSYRVISGNSAWGASRPLGSQLVELTQADRIYKLVLVLKEVGNERNMVVIETTKLDFPDNQ